VAGNFPVIKPAKLPGDYFVISKKFGGLILGRIRR